MLGPMKDEPRPEDAGKLAPDLARKLREVGPAQYGYATARDFTRGGKYNPKPRAKYALT